MLCQATFCGGGFGKHRSICVYRDCACSKSLLRMELYVFPGTQRPTLTTHHTAGCCQELPLQRDDDTIARNLAFHAMLVEPALQAGNATGSQLPSTGRQSPQRLRSQNRPHNPFQPADSPTAPPNRPFTPCCRRFQIDSCGRFASVTLDCPLCSMLVEPETTTHALRSDRTWKR
jgi:hypothetical protein